jgi:hypothetical protein
MAEPSRRMTAAGPLDPGTRVIAGRRLGRVVKRARLGPAEGYNIAAAPECHEGTAPHFYAAYAVQVAEVGVNVCPTPRGGCWCGLVHVDQPDALRNGPRA